MVAQAPARSRRPRKKLGAVIERQHAAANDACGLRRKSQALFFRRRHQPRRPPLAKIKPGSPGTHEGEWDGPCARGKREGAVKLRLAVNANTVAVRPRLALEIKHKVRRCCR